MAKFSVSYTFHGRASDTIEANDLDHAKALIGLKVESDDFEIGAEEIDDVDFTVQEMHPITRDGRELWTTYIRAGDVRGHASAMTTAPLFSGIPAQEAAPEGAVAK